jgi:hypothetical protein
MSKLPPNYRGWSSKFLKEIIRQHNDKTTIYFDVQTRRNLQNKWFAKAELKEIKRNKQ